MLDDYIQLQVIIFLLLAFIALHWIHVKIQSKCYTMLDLCEMMYDLLEINTFNFISSGKWVQDSNLLEIANLLDVVLCLVGNDCRTQVILCMFSFIFKWLLNNQNSLLKLKKLCCNGFLIYYASWSNNCDTLWRKQKVLEIANLLDVLCLFGNDYRTQVHWKFCACSASFIPGTQEIMLQRLFNYYASWSKSRDALWWKQKVHSWYLFLLRPSSDLST